MKETIEDKVYNTYQQQSFMSPCVGGKLATNTQVKSSNLLPPAQKL